MIAEYRELKQQRDRHGSTSKETKSLRSRMQRRRSSMLATMQKIDAWTDVAESKCDKIATTENLDKWIHLGEVPFGTGSRMQVARTLFIACHEYSRACEEDDRIHDEFLRLSCYLQYMKRRVSDALESLPSDSFMQHAAFDCLPGTLKTVVSACAEATPTVARRCLLNRKMHTLNALIRDLKNYFPGWTQHES